jgi:hypothetical protein
VWCATRKLLLDLQLGERSVLAMSRFSVSQLWFIRAINMDILVALGLADTKVPVLLLYNTGCQWQKRLVMR